MRLVNKRQAKAIQAIKANSGGKERATAKLTALKEAYEEIGASVKTKFDQSRSPREYTRLIELLDSFSDMNRRFFYRLTEFLLFRETIGQRAEHIHPEKCTKIRLEIVAAKNIIANLLVQAFELDQQITKTLATISGWDIWMAENSRANAESLFSKGIFNPDYGIKAGLELQQKLQAQGGEVLFLGAGIGEEAEVMLETCDPQEKGHIHPIILESELKYAMIAMMRGYDLLFDRPVDLNEKWGEQIFEKMDVIVHTATDYTMVDPKRVARQIKLALKPGGVYIEKTDAKPNSASIHIICDGKYHHIYEGNESRSAIPNARLILKSSH